MDIYAVINMDIVGSRKLKDRENVQKKLKTYLEELTLKNKALLVAPITLTLGDEWQIVLRSPEEAYNVYREIEVFLNKEKIKSYCGIGFGNISTEIYTDTRAMDGFAFVYAREAINIAKDSNKYYSKYLNSKENRVYFKGEDIDIITNSINTFKNVFEEVALTAFNEKNETLTLNQVINCMIENNEVLENKFTTKQKEIIELYEKKGSYNLMIKENPNLSKASISQKLNASNYFVSKYNKNIIKLLLNKYIIALKERYNGL